MEKFINLPEKSLGVAIIIRAVQDALGAVALGHSPEKRHQGKLYSMDALSWLFQDEGTLCESFSFAWWCDVLSLDRDSIRSFVLKNKKPRKRVNLAYVHSLSRNDEINLWLKMLELEASEEYKLAL